MFDRTYCTPGQAVLSVSDSSSAEQQDLLRDGQHCADLYAVGISSCLAKTRSNFCSLTYPMSKLRTGNPGFGMKGIGKRDEARAGEVEEIEVGQDPIPP